MGFELTMDRIDPREFREILRPDTPCVKCGRRFFAGVLDWKKRCYACRPRNLKRACDDCRRTRNRCTHRGDEYQ